LAPHHRLVESNFFELRSLRLLLDSLQEPALIVGAGQGLIVAELLRRGYRCNGIDLSSEMIRQAKLRRGLTLIQADAKAMPFASGSYKSIIYATGVIDFIGDESDIRSILNEGRRVADGTGKIFVAFYRLSRVQEDFLKRVGLLSDNYLSQRRSLEVYLLNPLQMVAWVANHAGVSRVRATAMLLGLSVRSRPYEIKMTLRMQKIFRDPRRARALLSAAPSEQPYRNAAEIEILFQRLAVPIKQVRASASAFIVEV
jgi:hypothetical protein